MSITIYHNPACGTSRNVLAFIREAGTEPHIIEYLKTPLTREELVALLKKMHIPARELLRAKGLLYDELGLADMALSEEKLVNAMVEHPILINRPIVVTAEKAKLCRPFETIIELLTDD